LNSAVSKQAPKLSLISVDLFERATTLRLPFKFGAAIVTQCPQAFVRVRLRIEDHTSDGLDTIYEGASAELMVPKWFDKEPQLSHEENFNQLRLSCQLASAAFLEAGTHLRSAFALSQIASQASIFLALAQGLPRLAAQFGPALLDKAIADALLRGLKLNWVQGLQAAVLGDPYSSALKILAPTKVYARHTVGMLDRLVTSDPGVDPNDGLPATLEAAIQAYGLSYFKIKLSGGLAEDIERLSRIQSVIAMVQEAQVTLDGNETFENAEHLAWYWRKLKEATALTPLLQKTLLLEQPLPRKIALMESIKGIGLDVPVILDESDDHPEALKKGLDLGYSGISSKACKGIYRSLQSAFLLKQRRDLSPHLLLSGEDLTCQAGLAVQQDTFLAASLGVTHIERNGHHYVNGFGTAPEQEALSFAKAHPSIYLGSASQRPRLRIHKGQLDLQSLYVPGFASKTFPLWESLNTMPNFPSRNL
jgi:Enolase C-terminal domain-like